MALLPLARAAAQVPAGVVFFDQVSDTIVMAGHTVLGTTATFEARVYFPTGVGDDGRVFNEWTDFLEDKLLYAGPDYVAGYTAPVAGTVLDFGPSLTLDSWHHLAFVHDGPSNEQRLYIDGVKVATQTGSGDIGDGGGDDFGRPFLGAIRRGGTLEKGFIGYLDTFRISDHARYTGDSFTAPTGDLTDDANTVVLFNFAADEITFGQNPTVSDLSGNGHDGTLGAGFPDATGPFVPTGLDVDANGSITALTDGLLVLRHLSGFTGTSLSTGATGPSCARCDGDAIGSYISGLAALLDVDEDETVGALTDGVLILRRKFGFTGAALVANALGMDCERCDPAEIATYIDGLE